MTSRRLIRTIAVLVPLAALAHGCGGTEPTDATTGGTAGVALGIYSSSHPAGGRADVNGGQYSNVHPGQFEAYGGSPVSGYTWTVTTGTSMPFPGLIIDPLTGLVHGAMPSGTATGRYPYQVTVSDGSTTATSSGAYFEVTSCNSLVFGNVDPSACDVNSVIICGSGSLVDVSVGSTHPFTAGKAVGFSLHVAGGTPPYKSWTVASGSLPPGLTLDQSRGVITGTPLSSASGQTYTFTARVSDSANKTCPSSTQSPAQFTMTIK